MTFQPQFDPYPNLRQVVDPTIAFFPHPMLRARIDGQFGDGTADSIEGDLEGVFDGFSRAMSSFGRDAGRFVSQAAPVVANIGGGVIKGAMAGSSAGLPGIIAGAAIGGTGAGLSQYGSGTARDVGNALTGVTNFAGQFTPMGRMGQTIGGTVGALGQAAGQRGGIGANLGGVASSLAGGLAGQFGGGGGMGGMASSLLGGGGRGGMGQNLMSMLPQMAGGLTSLFGSNTAAGQLASAIQRPELQQALAAMRLGSLGRPSIPVGSAQSPVPTGAFSQLLSYLVGQVAHEWSESAGEGSEAAEVDFMRDGENGFLGDPSSPADRAARLWAMLNAAQSERFDEAIAMKGAAAEVQWNEAWQPNETETADQTEVYDSEAEYFDQLDRAEAEAIEAELEAMTFKYADAEVDSYV